MDELKLGEPGASWHASQDRFAECISLFGLIAAERREDRPRDLLSGPHGDRRGLRGTGRGRRSAAAPCRKNKTQSAARPSLRPLQTLRAQVPLAIGATVGQDDRDMGAGIVFWKADPGGLRADRRHPGAADPACWAACGSIPPPCAGTLSCTGGLIVAEAVMLALAGHIGREAAHEAVSPKRPKRRCARRARASRKRAARAGRRGRAFGHEDMLAELLDPERLYRPGGAAWSTKFLLTNWRTEKPDD